MAAVGAMLLPALLLVSSWAGWRVQKLLPSHHRSRDTVEAVRLMMTMLLTFAAIMLGLLTTAAKSRYDLHQTNLSRYSVNLIMLDQSLRQYGPAADAARTLLRAYAAAAIADNWPREPPPAGSYPLHPAPFLPGSLDSDVLGSMLLQIDTFVTRLAPADPFHEIVAATLRSRTAALLQQRWVLVESARATISWPFLSVMMAWLVLVFAIFGLTAPANALIYAVIGVTALSVSLALYMIVNFDTPLTGLIAISSDSLREALMHMDQPVTNQ